MEKGIDEFMSARFAKDGRDWIAYRKAMKKAKRWEVEVYQVWTENRGSRSLLDREVLAELMD